MADKTETDEFYLAAYENVGNSDILNFLASVKNKGRKTSRCERGTG